MSNTLSKYFLAIGAKRLSQVEVSSQRSNQHEINGIDKFKRIFGLEKALFETTYIKLDDDENKVASASGIMTWYDARENHPIRTEYRLYYSSNDVIKSANAGDLLVVGKLRNNKLAVIIASRGTTSEKQLLWLFGIAEVLDESMVKDFTSNTAEISFAGKYILSTLGFEIEETAPDYLEELLKRFGNSFPSTKIFSDFSRSTINGISPIDEPDKTLIMWLEREELLFKTLESFIVKEKLEKGFGEDGRNVDEFIQFSLSVQNRRKARAGYAFENNLALIFQINELQFSHEAATERNNRPDFLFPGIEQYHDQKFNVDLLTMLGVKTTAKDRWRQVLSEAAKVPNKHLITLEPAISKNQTEEMKASNLQLVIPEQLFSTYLLEQRDQLISLKNFIQIVRDKQKRSNKT
ncbi:type II restriction endonuclease [Pedobacter nutrimenti]|uniref:EcoRII-like protein n=1 Tax=Pedobacter nutrimenti TaxID=1241337 RepID=A0A318UDR1_9SPHI|nr:type II restriction endonuclease [Pedobacter nutrimenti]PYF74351.1 EcoRII-like protein [Pedobacter nutrimenti]